MSSTKDKGRRMEIWQWMKMLLPLGIVCLLAEVIALGAWVGPYPQKWKIILVCLFPYLLIVLIGMIPVVQHEVVCLEQRVELWFRGLKKRNWKKGICIFTADFIIGLVLERVLTYMAEGSITADLNTRKLFFSFTIIFLCSIIFCFHQILIQKVEVAVLLIILSIGSVYVTALPVSCGISWDDEMHFLSALKMSHILDGKMTQADWDVWVHYIDTAVEHKNYTQAEHDEWTKQLNADQKSGVCWPDERISPTIQNWVYIPAAIGLAIGRALRLPYAMDFILGKWCNLLIYAFLVYWSIRKLKSKKMLAAVVSLLPPCMLMASSYSRDPWMIGFIMLGFSWFIGELQEKEKKINTWDIIVMVGSFVIGIAPKAVYVPLILICLFMPKEKFQSEKQCKRFRMIIIIVTILLIATFAVPFLLSNGGAWEDKRGGSDVDAIAQTAYILQEPLEYFKLLFRFLWDYSISEESRTFLTNMHYLGTAKYALVLDVLLIVVTFTDCSNVDRNIKLPAKVVTLVMSFGSICLVATAMYIAFTPLKLNTILGCQHRYILQFLFPVLCVIGSIPIENKIQKDWYRGIVLGISSFVLLNGIWDLCISTF